METITLDGETGSLIIGEHFVRSKLLTLRDKDYRNSSRTSYYNRPEKLLQSNHGPAMPMYSNTILSSVISLFDLNVHNIPWKIVLIALNMVLLLFLFIMFVLFFEKQLFWVNILSLYTYHLLFFIDTLTQNTSYCTLGPLKASLGLYFQILLPILPLHNWNAIRKVKLYQIFTIHVDSSEKFSCIFPGNIIGEMLVLLTSCKGVYLLCAVYW